MPFKNQHPLYSCWQSMKRRCDNPNNKQYKDYGGRGITVCDKWINDFHAFVADMGDKPSKHHTLDRINNDLGYSPDNCRWATRKEQARNRRYSVFVIIDGKQYRAVELADIAGVKTDTILERANKGLSYDKVISKDKLLDLSGLSLGGKANGIRKRALTHCIYGHEYTSENTATNKNGHRYCKKCKAIKARAYRERKLLLSR